MINHPLPNLVETPTLASISADSAMLCSPQLYRDILDHLPFSLSVTEVISRTEFRFVFMNRYTRQQGGHGEVDHSGKRINEVFSPKEIGEVMRQYQQCLDTGATVERELVFTAPNGRVWWRTSCSPVRNAAGQITHIATIGQDITAQKQREAEERQRQEEIIEHQAATLAELSTPMLTISDTTVVMPLVGAVDSRRVTQIMDSLLGGVAASRATNVILDITGVSVVDTQVANAFIQVSQAVKLLGAQIILTGIRPEVAQTLVGLGVDLRGIVTRGTLRDGITYALGG